MSNKGNFQKGHIPWNKEKKGIHLSPETEFKKGQRAGEKNNTWKGGVQEMQKDVVHLYTGVGERIRRPKKVLEDAGETIPKGWVIYHLDKNKHNDSIDNLIVIPRSILIKINNGLLNANYQNIKAEIEIFKNQQTTN